MGTETLCYHVRNATNYLELEYERLYDMRDQTMLFLKLCPRTAGLAEGMLVWLDGKVRMLGEKLMEMTE